MRTLLFALLLGAIATAPVLSAEIQIIVRNDAGTVVSDVTLKIEKAVLAGFNQWRLAQMKEDGTQAYPTPASFWWAHIGGFFRSKAEEFVQTIQEKRAQIKALEAEIEKLREAVVQP